MPLLSVGETDITPLRLILFFAVILGTLIAGRFFSRALQRLLRDMHSVSPAARYVLVRIQYYATLVIGFFLAVSTLGINLTQLALVGGALGVGIGFGLQNIVNNLVSGLILLLDRSLKINDYVELDGGVCGVVREISMRYTRICTNDNIDILIPNSLFIDKMLVNYTHQEDLRRVHIPFGVAYGSDKEIVKKAALEAASRVRHTLRDHPDRKTDVWLVNFGDSSLDFELVVWITETSARLKRRLTSDYLWELETSLAQYGIEIPFPQRDLHIKSGPQVLNP